MARIDLAKLTKLTKAELLAIIAKMAEDAPVASEASQHYAAKDLPCPVKGDKCLDDDGNVKRFRTVKGAEWHKANIKHA